MIDNFFLELLKKMKLPYPITFFSIFAKKILFNKFAFET